LAKRKTRPRSLWTNPLQRVLGALARKTVRKAVDATAKAARKAVRSAVERAVTGEVKSPRKRPVARPVAREVKQGGELTSGVAVAPSGARSYRLYKPPGSTAAERLPLLVMLHGCGQDADEFAAVTRMNAIAARERFIVLYPLQDRLANAQGCWNWFETRSGRALGEEAILMSAIDQTIARHGADASRVAIVGLSAGASMAALLASHHPGRFKAVVMHSGVAPGLAHSALTALGAMRGRRSRAATISPVLSPLTSPITSPLIEALTTPWPPLLVIQGLADHVVAASNGPDAAAYWAAHAQARPGPARPIQRGERHRAKVTDYRRGGRTAVTLWQIESLGHAWSGGPAARAFSDARGPDASRLAWAFAKRAFDR
jgi:poly(hydroxyalkanoate) depolymerase family esterase